MSNEERNAPPSTAEMYLRATCTSHLELGERRGDVDRIIAAGLTGGLGMRLFRLVNEYQGLDRTIKVSMPSNSQVTHRALVLVHMNMTSLYEAKHALFEYAQKMAARRGWEIAEDVMRKLVGKCLDSFLDDICGHCSGAKVTGAYGGPQPTCRQCKGTGKHSGHIGTSPNETAFGYRLLHEMEQMTYDAEDGLRRNLRAVDNAKDWIAEQTRP